MDLHKPAISLETQKKGDFIQGATLRLSLIHRGLWRKANGRRTSEKSIMLLKKNKIKISHASSEKPEILK
jgi:hypothetical protein